MIQPSGETDDELRIGTSVLALDGVRYDNVQAFIGGRFDAPSQIVPPETLSTSVQAPFTFAGWLRVNSAEREQILFTTAIGEGTARAVLHWHSPSLGYYDDSDSITYIFDDSQAPVPEPPRCCCSGQVSRDMLLRRRPSRGASRSERDTPCRRRWVRGLRSGHCPILIPGSRWPSVGPWLGSPLQAAG